MMMSLYSIDWK